ncbi:MAG: hypothetical protein KC713_08455, partial [Candidatus Omnitrophica bacterium]|nr:hypothetical protein [Candidatus Omnitrophota bacterium]
MTAILLKISTIKNIKRAFLLISIISSVFYLLKFYAFQQSSDNPLETAAEEFARLIFETDYVSSVSLKRGQIILFQKMKDVEPLGAEILADLSESNRKESNPANTISSIPGQSHSLQDKPFPAMEQSDDLEEILKNPPPAIQPGNSLLNKSNNISEKSALQSFDVQKEIQRNGWDVQAESEKIVYTSDRKKSYLEHKLTDIRQPVKQLIQEMKDDARKSAHTEEKIEFQNMFVSNISLEAVKNTSKLAAELWFVACMYPFMKTVQWI